MTNQKSTTLANEVKINDKPITIGRYLDDGFITIETESGQLLGLTYEDAKKLIVRLSEQIACHEIDKGMRPVN